MREYAKLAPTFWTGETGKALRRRGSEALLVALYLVSAPGSNMLGLYYQPKLFMAHETGLGVEGASKGLQHCIDVGFCSYDEDTEMVFVHEMAAWQVAESLSSGDNRCKGIQKDYEALPACAFLEAWFERYAEAFHLTRKRSNPVEKPEVIEAPSKALAKPLRSQEQEQEQEQETPPNPRKRGRGGSVEQFPPGFDAFWSAYPRKIAKSDAAKAFARLKVDEGLLQRMLVAVSAQAESEQWRKDRGQFIPHPATWLNGSRWEDAAGVSTSADIFAGAR